MRDLLGIIAWLVIPLVSVAIDILPARRAGSKRVCVITDQTPIIDDFEVLVPIYGDVKYLENLSYLADYGAKVMLCTTDQEDERFNHNLEMIAARYGLRIFKTKVIGRIVENGQRCVAAPIRDKVICDALAEVKATYVVCIDADTVTEQPLGVLVGALEVNHLDVASVRLLPSNRATLLARLQGHEYRMAMRMRRLYPWLVSGACHVARTAVHHKVMQRHSLFFQGNDAEFGLLADSMGFNVGHIPFDVPTTVPETFKPWWRQRFAWAGGEFRLYVVNIRFARKHPYFFFYGAVVVILGVPLRWMSVLSMSWMLLYVLGVYYLAFIVMNWTTRDRSILLLPFYSLLLTLVLVPLGLLSYLKMAWGHHNYGIIRPGPRLPTRRSTAGIQHEMIQSVRASGLTVADLQHDLTAVGQDPGPQDGVLGPKTQRAIIAWQQVLIQHGHDLGVLEADGVFGYRTAAASRLEAPWVAVQDDRLSTSEWIDTIERRLFEPRPKRSVGLPMVTADVSGNPGVPLRHDV